MPTWILHTLVVVETVALLVGGPLLVMFLKERIKNIARESTEKALADYKHEHDQALVSINADYQRQLQRFSLYTRRRHAVYGELYRKVRIASDAYAAMIGFSWGPDFSKYVREDAEEYFARHKVPISSRKNIIAAFDCGDASRPATLLQELDDRVRKHNAGKAFARAKNVEAACELYLSDAVREQMHNVRASIAAVSVAAGKDGDRDGNALGKCDTMSGSVSDLFRIMREEMSSLATGESLWENHEL